MRQPVLPTPDGHLDALRVCRQDPGQLDRGWGRPRPRDQGDMLPGDRSLRGSDAALHSDGPGTADTALPQRTGDAQLQRAALDAQRARTTADLQLPQQAAATQLPQRASTTQQAQQAAGTQAQPVDMYTPGSSALRDQLQNLRDSMQSVGRSQRGEARRDACKPRAAALRTCCACCATLCMACCQPQSLHPHAEATQACEHMCPS